MNKIPYIGFGCKDYINQEIAETIPTNELMMQEINEMNRVLFDYRQEIELYKETVDLQRKAINMSKEYIESLEHKKRTYNIAIGIFCILAGLKLLGII
jgi:predicted DNA-binding protein YlxM (UPF0122 family)